MFSTSACTNGRFSNDLEVWVRIIATRHVYNVVWPCALNVVWSCVSEFRPTAIGSTAALGSGSGGGDRRVSGHSTTALDSGSGGVNRSATGKSGAGVARSQTSKMAKAEAEEKRIKV